VIHTVKNPPQAAVLFMKAVFFAAGLMILWDELEIIKPPDSNDG
jgi:hypothetical protein